MQSEPLDNLLRGRIAAGDFPSAVYLVGERGQIRFHGALGLAVKEPVEIPVRAETIYDLASLTKPLITNLLIAKLIERGEIALSTAIAELLPEFNRDDERGITIQNLLTHTSGFPAWKPFYLKAKGEGRKAKEEVLRLIAVENLGSEPNDQARYSDYNFLALGFLLEKLYDQPLDEISNNEIFAPLGLTEAFFNPPSELRPQIAASERGNEFEKQLCRDLGFDIEDFAWREDVIWGEVHDCNAYFLGGFAGHAGLFSTAAEAFRIAGQFLPGTTELLKPETCELFQRNFTVGLDEARSLAFELAANKDSTASTALAPNSFGHLGFAGTSLWIEPASERVFILLTNRTHARSLPFMNINSTRRRFHELAAALLNQNDE